MVSCCGDVPPNFSLHMRCPAEPVTAATVHDDHGNMHTEKKRAQTHTAKYLMLKWDEGARAHAVLPLLPDVRNSGGLAVCLRYRCNVETKSSPIATTGVLRKKVHGSPRCASRVSEAAGVGVPPHGGGRRYVPHVECPARRTGCHKRVGEWPGPQRKQGRMLENASAAVPAGAPNGLGWAAGRMAAAPEPPGVSACATREATARESACMVACGASTVPAPEVGQQSVGAIALEHGSSRGRRGGWGLGAVEDGWHD